MCKFSVHLVPLFGVKGQTTSPLLSIFMCKFSVHLVPLFGVKPKLLAELGLQTLLCCFRITPWGIRGFQCN
ncbi:unnamed protein product [Acanthoscelides obtectus]|uniref:Uncharacterized protein n=1 Tax=Acanthoscelides obtectus TaxID=200917 RepID=A0A9P0Q8W9_ACAOB|nr:unnamed protein product [Acanthoscelides obtectus]CAK1628378.1 hypothetical protein AOBTE_LOCUS5165 [Acanthoscelides obtectus]